MSELLDKDKLRERLVLHLDKNYRVPMTEMAQRIGISPLALSNFIHGARSPYRKTLGIVRAYLESLESSEEVE